MYNELFEELLKRFEERIQHESDWVASGAADQHSLYKASCGKIAGFRDAQEIVRDLRTLINKQENDE